MCECGCGEFRPIGKLRVKGGWYGIEIYPGCEYCETTWALGVTLLKNADEDTKHLLEGVDEITFDARGQWGTPILDTKILRAEFASEAEGGDDPDSEANFALGELITRGGLRRVHYLTLQQHRLVASSTPSSAGRESPNE